MFRNRVSQLILILGWTQMYWRIYKWHRNNNFLVLDLAGIFMQESRQIFNLSRPKIYYQICHLKPVSRLKSIVAAIQHSWILKKDFCGDRESHQQEALSYSTRCKWCVCWSAGPIFIFIFLLRTNMFAGIDFQQFLWVRAKIKWCHCQDFKKIDNPIL